MELLKRRIRRTVVLSILIALVLLPVSAVAAPRVDPGDDDRVGMWIRADDDQGDQGDQGNQGDQGGSGDEGDQGDQGDQGGSGDEGDTALILGAGLGGETPGTPPTAQTGGFDSIDTASLPVALGAAVTMFDQAVIKIETVSAPIPVGGRWLSRSLTRVLPSVLPPLVRDLIVSPIVTLEALFQALVASGQALVVPVVAAGTAGLFGSHRRRDIRTVLEKSQLS